MYPVARDSSERKSVEWFDNTMQLVLDSANEIVHRKDDPQAVAFLATQIRDVTNVLAEYHAGLSADEKIALSKMIGVRHGKAYAELDSDFVAMKNEVTTLIGKMQVEKNLDFATETRYDEIAKVISKNDATLVDFADKIKQKFDAGVVVAVEEIVK
jgi:hypothetical protein